MTVLSIKPPDQPINGAMRPPGSKSHTIRALFLSACARGKSVIKNSLDSVDTRDARDCLRDLGVSIADDGELWLVSGSGGQFGVPEGPLDAGESGLTARFLLALAPFIPGHLTVQGRGRLRERPMAELLDTLKSMGVSTTGQYPWSVHGGNGLPGGELRVDASRSSQLVSALLISAPLADTETTLSVTGLSSSVSYVDMTVELMNVFGANVIPTSSGFVVSPGGYSGCEYETPVDASAAVYPAGAAAITGGELSIHGDLGAHPDLRFFDVLEMMGCHIWRAPDEVKVVGPDQLTAVEVDMSDAPDAAVTLAVLCAAAKGESRIRGLQSLRFKESDRLAVLQSELSKFGADVRVVEDTLLIDPGEPRPAVFSSHDDHRIAMSLSLLGLVGDGVAIESPDAVAKTWPGYWDWYESTGASVERR